ncbi:hypothetical protein J1N35_003845 [Gossypium stocksii]|uniref:Uncharacterized protein n=1 Tax=Gossypium stocksii TaxID=47602 RepID=A0A9D3WCE7_9ROSI|nr:hypothetical protein J1N35_003845 [Gossypium stocksii]
MPNVNNNKVHLIYFPLLSDLEVARLYNLRSVVLATLCRELCWATKHEAQDISGYQEIETIHYLSTDD